MKTPEILAPAGGFDAVEAAVRCGANAVYLGGKAFNARLNASNFTEDTLLQAVNYCHARNVKVYITLNTLVSDSQFKKAYQAIECACRINADALILQDIGIAAAVRECAPDMPIHASTQMSVQSADGIRRLAEMGFCRAVLPRELSLDEIRKIADSTDIELEAFVHGALCMSVSGQCLMSAVIGSRSGNRGLCAQPCRLPFGIDGSAGCALSLKDLSLVDELNRLAEAGVCSFKIEGRMKRPEYVAAAVTACRESLSGTLTDDLTQKLRAVFSRSGFTKGYFENRISPDMFGTRQKQDVEGAAGVLRSLERLYDNETPLIGVDFDIKCVAGEKTVLSARALGKSVQVFGNEPQPALTKALTAPELRERLSKCGSTQFFAQKIEIELGEGLNVPVSAINSLRRNALAALEIKISERNEKRFILPQQISASQHTAGECALHARFFDCAQIPEALGGITRVILPLDAPAETISALRSQGIEVVCEIPRAYFSNGDKYRALLRKAKQAGIGAAFAGTLDGVELAQSEGMTVYGGFGLNVFNSSTLSQLQKAGCADALLSCELTNSQIASLTGDLPRGIFAYGKIPLMLTRACPVKSTRSCAECGGKSELVDRTGAAFPVVCSNGCCEILNCRALYLADRLNEISGVDYRLLYFTNEPKSECARIISSYQSGASPEGEFTRGLFFRGVE